MSRAPAPMTLETNAAAAHNPYEMGTFAAMPNTMMPQYAMPGTAAPMHAMQNMYTNMQQPNAYGMPQPLVGQNAMHMGHPGNTMQNVSVVDFKPDILAQQHAAQLHQQYASHMNSMPTAAAHPSLGLVGPDGRYMAATAAAPVDMSPRFTHGPYDSAGTSSHQNGSWGSHGLHSHSRTQSHNPYDVPRRSMSTPRHSPNTANEFASSMATRAAMKNMIDERLPSSRAMKNMIDDRVDGAVRREVGKLATPHAAASTTSDFHYKPHEEQRRLVGKAVEDVMKDYHVTPKTRPGDGIGATSRSYDPDERARSVGSRFDRDASY
jgi:hypothetical protein